MEGAFYIWREDEIREVLGADAEVFIARYGVRPDGNAPFDPQAEFVHKNLLFTAKPIEEIVATTGLSVDEVEAVIAAKQGSPARSSIVETTPASGR